MIVTKIIKTSEKLDENLKVIELLLIDGYKHTYSKYPETKFKYDFLNSKDLAILIYDDETFTYINTTTVSKKNIDKITTVKNYLRTRKLKLL